MMLDNKSFSSSIVLPVPLAKACDYTIFVVPG